MSATGFGICGQKNSYSSKTKCGNWVQDRIGKAVAASLAAAPRPPVGSTVVRDDFVHPSKMTDTMVIAGDTSEMMSAADIESENREGVSFDLLFGHVRDSGHADALSQDRFQTNAGESFPATATMSASLRYNAARARDFRARQLIAKVARERRQISALSTTARLQGSQAGTGQLFV